MPAIPLPRGEISEQLLKEIQSPPHAVEIAVPPVGDPLTDDDLQLALYVCYELYYRSFEEVDPGWEWSPSLIAFRAQLEAQFESALAAAVGDHDQDPPPPDQMDVALRAIAESDDGPPPPEGHWAEKYRLMCADLPPTPE